MGQIEQFLNLAFGDYLDEANFGIVWLNKTTAWSWDKDVKKQAELVKRKKTNAYFSIGVSSSKLKKGSQEQVEGVVGLALDADIESPVHTRNDLPKTEEEAISLVKSAIPEKLPTVIVNTGHGVQAFWFFNEPWIFENLEEKEACKKLFLKFYLTASYYSSGKGWHLDKTADISHLYRLPGTINLKDDDPTGGKDTYIVEIDEHRLYNPDSFDDVLIEKDYINQLFKDQISKNENRTYGKGKYGLVVDPNAQPPDDKFKTLASVDEQFCLLWEKAIDEQMKRREIDPDVSLSRYDFKLAKLVAKYSWSPQEICDLLIAFRRKHAQTNAEHRKLNRADYYERTIQMAMKSLITEDVDKDFKEVADEIRQDSITGRKRSQDEIEARKNTVRAGIKTRFELNIHSIRKYLSEPPEYELVFDDGNKLLVGTSKVLFDQQAFRRLIFDYIGVMVSPCKRAQDWIDTIKSWQVIIEEVNTSTDTRELDFLESMIVSYVSRSMVGEKEFDEACSEELPFKRDNGVYMFYTSFKKYLYLIANERYSTRHLTLCLNRLGCKKRKWNYIRRDNIRTTARPYDVTHILDGHEESKLEVNEQSEQSEQDEQDDEFVIEGE